MKRYARMLLLFTVLIAGCGYGEVSPTAYEYAKALYNISNRKLSDRVGGAKEQIVASLESGEISKKEAKWLNGIVENAENERWKQAMKSARRLMEDQVDR